MNLPILLKPRVLVCMQITRLGERMGSYSARQRQMGINLILSRVSEAYGRMMLYEGLFQADGHPGNILVMKGARHSTINGMHLHSSLEWASGWQTASRADPAVGRTTTFVG